LTPLPQTAALEHLRTLELRYDGPIPREALADLTMPALERQVVARRDNLTHYTLHCQKLVDALRQPDWRTFRRETLRNALRDALWYRRLLLRGWIEARRCAREAV
jgi:hypothetical protein